MRGRKRQHKKWIKAWVETLRSCPPVDFAELEAGMVAAEVLDQAIRNAWRWRLEGGLILGAWR